MDALLESHSLYLLLVTAEIGFSVLVCKAINSQRITAERAFWGAWGFLIVSAEIVTNFDFFEYPYSIDIATRRYTIEFFLACTIGFVAATIMATINSGVKKSQAKPYLLYERCNDLRGKMRTTIPLVFFLIGIVEFLNVFIMYGNLLVLREAALEDMPDGFQAYLYIFYFAQAYLLLLGYKDGGAGKISKGPLYLTVAGLIFHNLSIGGRINIVVAPLFYVVSYMLRLDRNTLIDKKQYFISRRYFIRFLAIGFVLFSLIGLLRTLHVDFSSVFTIDGFLGKVVFSVPKYISDAYVSISIHSSHALSNEPQLGKFTFDAFHRLFLKINLTEPVVPDIFGHLLYQDTPDPWAWTQTNVIPRLVADFGQSLYLLAAFLIAFGSQFVSIAFSGRGFLKHSVASMAIICCIYSIQAAMWFSAFTAVVLICCLIFERVSNFGSRRDYFLHVN